MQAGKNGSVRSTAGVNPTGSPGFDGCQLMDQELNECFGPSDLLMIVGISLVGAPMILTSTSPIGFRFSTSLAIMSVTSAARCMARRMRLVARSSNIRIWWCVIDVVILLFISPVHARLRRRRRSWWGCWRSVGRSVRLWLLREWSWWLIWLLRRSWWGRFRTVCSVDLKPALLTQVHLLNEAIQILGSIQSLLKTRLEMMISRHEFILLGPFEAFD